MNSIDGMGNSTSSCQSGSCKKKKTTIVIPIVAAVAAVLFVICAVLVTLWMIKKRKGKGIKEKLLINS
jgi:disulfide bond formation protein DsbB